MFVGTQMKSSLMLIDTQANGTAIQYEGSKSESFIEIEQEEKEVRVELLDGFIMGKNVTDQICLDKNEDICIDQFTFTMATDIEYPKVITIETGGVIPFNNYKMTDSPNMRLVTALNTVSEFSHKTLQLDF